MYAAHFGLQQEAFSIAPDPRFLHLSAGHREALAHLLYGLQGGGGFVLLTGEIGTGKTTVCRCFLEQMPAGHRVAYVVNPKLTPLELMQTLCQEFGLAVEAGRGRTLKPYVDALNHFLLQVHAQGGQCLLVVDEAQALAPRLLEMLRLLTNLETAERKLLQIVLIGQPELRQQLGRPELEQLSQRVIARVHLGPLNADETAGYVLHRLRVAGLQGPGPFSRRALAQVHRLSAGVPRRINLLCQRALLGAYAQGEHQVTPALVRLAAREAFDGTGAAARPALPALLARWRWAAGGAAAAALLLAAVALVPDVGQAPDAGATRAAAPQAAAATAAPDPARPASSMSTGPVRTAPLQPYADAAQAWTALARAWGLPAAGRCNDATAQALACHEGRADWALLQRLDRPLLLALHDGGLVLLRAVNADAALLAGAAGDQRVDRSTLQAAWTGAIATWWRPPPGWGDGRRRPGPEAAAWALQRLTALQGPLQGQAAGQPARDEWLRQRVFAFQVAQALPLDGLAGPVTLMMLNRASQVDEPRLQRLEP